MTQFLSYWFYPNLGTAPYDNPKVMTALIVSIACIALAFAIMWWRKSIRNPITKKLSSSWSMAAFWFGIVGVMLTVSRAEGIQFLSMRILWVVWGLALAAYVFFQVLQFRRRHYTVVEKQKSTSELDRYLPKKKR